MTKDQTLEKQGLWLIDILGSVDGCFRNRICDAFRRDIEKVLTSQLDNIALDVVFTKDIRTVSLADDLVHNATLFNAGQFLIEPLKLKS